MAALTAKAPELTKEPGVYISGDHRGRPTKVEAYFRFNVEWRGETIVAELTGDIYEHSSGWSDWRVIMQRSTPPVSDTARRAITEACRPIALHWFATEEYRHAYKRALRRLIARTIRDETYSTDRAREAIAEHRDTLEPSDVVELERAVGLLDELLELTKDR